MIKEKLRDKSVQNVEKNPSARHCDILPLLPIVSVFYANHYIPKGHIVYIFRAPIYTDLRALVSLF